MKDIRKAVVVLAPSFALMGLTALSPALAQIAKAFPDMAVSKIQMLLSLPPLIAVCTMLLTGFLCKRIRKKSILICALSLMLVGGLLPLLCHQTFPFLLVCAGIYGAGLGGLGPLSSALIQEHFPPEQQGKLLGIQSAVIGIGSCAFSYAGGLLASRIWWHTYFAFFLLAPVLLIALFLPRGKPDGQADPGKSELEKPRFLSFELLLIPFFIMLGTAFIFALNNNIAMLIAEKGFGSSVIAGKTMSFYSIASILGGLATGSVLAYTKRNSIPVWMLAFGTGLVIASLASSYAVLVVGACLCGFAFSMRMPSGYTEMRRLVDASSATMAVSVVCCFSNFGQFLSPVLVGTLRKAVGGSISWSVLLSGVCLLLCAGIFLLLYRRVLRRLGKAS